MVGRLATNTSSDEWQNLMVKMTTFDIFYNIVAMDRIIVKYSRTTRTITFHHTLLVTFLSEDKVRNLKYERKLHCSTGPRHRTKTPLFLTKFIYSTVN